MALTAQKSYKLAWNKKRTENYKKRQNYLQYFKTTLGPLLVFNMSQMVRHLIGHSRFGKNGRLRATEGPQKNL